ncbi:MAG TPA: DUF4184 family protein [Candidatus Angelobacter sp.]|nr:DUF4184 family protein [Candidatus Angelobacter sp.]
MPFTLAHPAAVLPFRRFLVFSALVVGSVAPDFHYFFNLGPRGHFSHSIQGAFLFALPVSITVLWVFQTVMKAPLIALAPQRHQEKLFRFATPFRWLPINRFVLILFSLMIGIATHLLWDSITHERGLVVRNFADLRAPALEEFGSQRPLYNVLQHASSLLGLAVLAAWYWRWYRRAPVQAVPNSLQVSRHAKTSIVTLVLAGAAGAAIVFASIVSKGPPYQRSIFIGTTVTTFMSLSFTGALAFSVWWQWRRWRARELDVALQKQ